jgi:prophage tail gpP-like protein
VQSVPISSDFSKVQGLFDLMAALELPEADEAHQVSRLQSLELELGGATLSGSTEDDSDLLTPTTPSVGITFEEAKDEAYKSQISAFYKFPEQG